MERAAAVALDVDLKGAEQVITELVRLHGLDFVLRICARLAIDREASHRAVQDFTGKDRT